MNPVLPIANYLCSRYIKVKAFRKYQDVIANELEAPNVFAVFDDDSEAYLGLVDAKHAALFPGRIFSDLLVRRTSAPILCHTDLDDVVTRFKEQKCEFIAVTNKDEFIGVVSELSLLTALIEQERSMNRERDALIKRLNIELNHRKLATSVFENTSEGILVTDTAGYIMNVNRGFIKSTGYQPEEVIGKSLKTLHSNYQNNTFDDAMWSVLLETGKWEGEVWNRRKNGDIYPEWMRINSVADDEGSLINYVAVFADIGPNKKLQQELQRLAFYDPLTDLPNRRLLLNRLQHAIAASVRSNLHGAILFIDLDDFKTLNDTKGHDIGDLMLTEVAARLQKCVRESDTVARLGGDEFVVMLENLDEEPEHAAIQAKAVGEKICSSVNQVYSLQGHEYYSSTSIGISLFRSNDATVDELLKYADTAMYQSKQSGRNTLRFFDPSMQAALEARAMLESDLRHAVSRRQFRLCYQMQVDIHSRVFGAEVLLRWDHPERGLISPATFIPLAEETGLIVPIGHYVLESACTQLKVWEADPNAHELVLAVNVSARQFRQPDFVDQVRSVLAQTGANPNRLKIEMTESLVLNNVADTVEKMQALKSIGISFSMDDFGTGYSSLSYLKLLPLDQLKIDQSFVCDIASDPDDAIIVKTIIVMANALELDVIAEGVETKAQLELLKKYGCAAFQGYLFGKPVPLPEFEQLLKRL